MSKSEFEVQCLQYDIMSEGQVFPIEKSQELHGVILESNTAESFGVRILSLLNDGSKAIMLPAPAEEKDFNPVLPETVSSYLNNQTNTINYLNNNSVINVLICLK